jgi:hypothetical protein
MTYLNAVIGYVIGSDNPMLSFSNEDKCFSSEMEQLHGQHPYLGGKIRKHDLIKLRDFLNEVLNEKS